MKHPAAYFSTILFSIVEKEHRELKRGSIERATDALSIERALDASPAKRDQSAREPPRVRARPRVKVIPVCVTEVRFTLPPFPVSRFFFLFLLYINSILFPRSLERKDHTKNEISPREKARSSVCR